MIELISQSVSKVVFIMVAITVCTAYLIGLMDTEKFMVLAVMVFSFFFTAKGPGASDESYATKKEDGK